MNNSPAGFHQYTCYTNVTYADSTAMSNYKPGIYQNITIGNGSNSITLTSSNNTIFRATGEIIINGPFDSGSTEFQLLRPNANNISI